MEKSTSSLLKLITCGSVDDGKSTLIGHILYDAKLLYADQEQMLILDSKAGNRDGKIDYSLLLDGLSAEREQGITIDVAYHYFTTNSRSFIVSDTPGHEEYTRNMAVGASFADLAVILVDASQGILTQTRRHIRICCLMGIRHFVFAVNKMDLIQYSQEPFSRITHEIENLCQGLSLNSLAIVPVCATAGDNVTKLSENMDWYNGPSLLNYLENIDISNKNIESGFYMPVQRVCRPNHSFRGFQGQIEAGSIHVGDKIEILPSNQTSLVKSIYLSDKEVQEASLGQAVTIQLTDEIDISRGCVLTQNAGLKIKKSFRTILLWMDDHPLSPNQSYWIKTGTKLLLASISPLQPKKANLYPTSQDDKSQLTFQQKLHSQKQNENLEVESSKPVFEKIDVNSGQILSTQSIEKNELLRCEITLSEPAVLDTFHLHKTLGELILIDRISHATAACGVIESFEDEEENFSKLSDEEKEVPIRLFDRFTYHPDIHSILLVPSSPATYRIGDHLPLQSAAFCYPSNFDLFTGSDFAHIRDSKFIGFGKDKSNYPLLDTDGIDLQDLPKNFSKYRNILAQELANNPTDTNAHF
ncbi:hypothetical protein FACS189418_7170 [Clostridia bacterium]|nr:hypothetical protein FACS189418_7170 [Clostridia bacterium]